MPELMNTIMADGPSSNPSQPVKAQLRAWGTWVESVITAFLSNGGLIYDTRASLNADLLHGANSSAWVVADPTIANNGIYRKLLGSGTGSWTRIADLPYSFIAATDAGAGTPNAIIATTSIPVPAADAAALISFAVFEANAGSPVTVAFNGGSPLTIKTASGASIAPGGLVAGMAIAGYKSGSTFRLISDQASAAIQAAAEAAQAAAEAARVAAQAAAADAALSAAAASGAVPVDNRTALKALNTSTKKVAIIWNEGPRNGRLAFNSANLSSQVTADTNEYTYVAPTSDPTGASGAWIYDSGLFVGKYPTPALRSEREKAQDRADLRDWSGLDLAGVNDNASLMNAALTATAGESVPLHVPSGDIVLGSMVSIPANASIIGTGPIGTIYQGDTLANQKRTKFHIGHTGKGFQAFGAGTRSFKGFTTYRDHAAPGVGWTPTTHDFDFDITDAAADIYFDEIVLLNPYKGIQTRRGAVRVHFNRVRGQPLFSGLEIHQAYDVMWGDQIGFWPFWSNDPNVRQWVRTNGVAFRFFRVDNPKLGVMFGIGYHFTLELGFDADGGPGLPGGSLSKGYINTLGGDSAAGVIHTIADSANVNLVIDKCYGHSGLVGDWTTNDHLIHDQGTNNRFSFGHLELGLQSSGNRLIAMRGTGGKLRASRAEFYRWDESAANNAALLVNAGNQITIDDYLTGSTSPGSTAPVVAHNAAGGVLEVPTWLAYTPTVGAVSGTITTLGTLTNRYQRRRNLLKLSIDVTVTTIGTATGGMTVSLPMSLTAVSVASGIWRNTSTGATGIITALAGAGVVTFSGFPVADGQRVIGSIEIELA